MLPGLGLFSTLLIGFVIWLSGLSITLYFQLSPLYAYTAGSIAVIIITEIREVLR